MRGLSSIHNAKIEKVIEVTQNQLSRDVATQYLKRNDWQVQAAIDMYFSEAKSGPPISNTRGHSKFSSTSVDALFNKYSTSGANMILAEGILKMCEDLQIEPTDPVLIVLSYYMQAETNCEFSRDEFIRGLRSIKCDNITKLRDAFPTLRQQLQSSDFFNDIYKFSYKWSCAKGKRFMDLNTALGMWELLFRQGRPWSHLDDWLEFVQSNSQGRQVIPQDTWVQLLEFINTVGDDYQNYDVENGAWPVLIDEFVEHMLEKQKA